MKSAQQSLFGNPTEIDLTLASRQKSKNEIYNLIFHEKGQNNHENRHN